MSSVCFTRSEWLPVFQKYIQKDELNFGLGGDDQVNRAQSAAQRIKDTVSLLLRRSDKLPYWD